MDTAWRKINVDQYDEDVLEESELYDPDPRDPGTILNDARQKANAVRSALAKLAQLSPSLGQCSHRATGATIRVLCYKCCMDDRPGFTEADGGR